MSTQLENRMDCIEGALNDLSVQLKEGGFVEKVSIESRLDPASTAWALQRWIDSIKRADIEQLTRSAKRLGTSSWRVTTLAPGNVPVVAAESLFLGYLSGVSHRLALSRRSSIVAKTLFSSLIKRDPSAALTTRLFVWQEMSQDVRKNALSSSDCVVVYGHAETVELIHRMIPQSARLIPHGPCLAVAYLPDASPLLPPLLQQLDALAYDVLAFDQRGCRSPHLLFVEGSPERGQKIFSVLADRSFPKAAKALPRGALQAEEEQGFYLDRLTSLSLGEAVSGEGWLLNFEASPYIPRTAPPGRALRVLSIPDISALAPLLKALPAPVGLLLTPDGTAPTAHISGPNSAEVLSYGSAHSSPFCRLHDGRHRLDELLPSPKR
jgi:hypothetical protein